MFINTVILVRKWIENNVDGNERGYRFIQSIYQFTILTQSVEHCLKNEDFYSKCDQIRSFLRI